MRRNALPVPFALAAAWLALSPWPALSQPAAPPAPVPAPRTAPPAQRPAPARPEGPANERRAQIDRLLDALAGAPDADAAAPVEARLRALWEQGASPAVRLLLRRAVRNLEAGAAGEAAEDLDAAITLQPDHAESWTLRGEALARAGDAAAAAADFRQALSLEPRHYPTLLALSALQEGRGDLAGAMRSLEAALRLNPRLGGGAERLRDLRRRSEGDDT